MPRGQYERRWRIVACPKCGEEKRSVGLATHLRYCGQLEAQYERMMARVDKQAPNGCWVYNGARKQDGYGMVGIGHKTFQVHRVVYARMVGPIPAGAYVLHRCDNPPCCNPAHLFLGDFDANIADKVAKGRQGHKLTQDQARAIKSRYKVEKRRSNAKALAAEFGVSEQHVMNVAHGRMWRTV